MALVLLLCLLEEFGCDTRNLAICPDSSGSCKSRIPAVRNVVRCFLAFMRPVWRARRENREEGLDILFILTGCGETSPDKPLLSNDHFSVDGTLIDAWASLKSFRAKDGSDEPTSPGRNGERQLKGEKRRNDTHASSTDPDAKLYRKSNSAAAKLSYIGHALAENHHGLIVEVDATQALSRAEREAALAMIERHDPAAERRLTLGADRDYDTAGFVAQCRRLCVTPHVASR